MLAKTKKFIVLFLIAGQFLFWPFFAFATTAGTGTINGVPTISGGSTASNILFNTELVPIQAALTTCTTAIQTFEKSDKAASVGLSLSAVIGGGSALADQYALEMNAYMAYLGCLEGGYGIPAIPKATPVLSQLKSLPTDNTYLAALVQQLIAPVNASIQTYRAKLETATGRYTVASQNIWKAFFITVLINTTKTVADQLVNKLVSNYKITNAKTYVDSVATLMYDNQFIRDNFPNTQGQMMARAILANPQLRTQIQPGIYLAANNALNFNGTPYTPSNVQYTDPDYYAKMALVGSSQANPYYLQMQYVSNLDASHANAVNAAQQQVNQGNGYKAPVSCSGSLAQQNQIDQQTKAASDLLSNRQGLLQSLLNAQSTSSNMTPAQQAQLQQSITKAQADVNSAQLAWNNLPFTVTGQNGVNNSQQGGGNNTEGTAAIVMCEAISSPAVLVNQGIDAVFKSLNLGNYNSNNLPSFLSSIAGMATQIGSSLVLGGITGNSAKINEGQLAGQAVSLVGAAAIQTYNNNLQANLAKGVDFEINQASGNTFNITWTVQTNQVQNASYVIITGPGLNPNSPSSNGVTTKQPIQSVSPISVTLIAQGIYTLTVYDVNGHSLVSVTESVTPLPPAASTATALNINPNSPEVAGAFTQKPALEIRGPVQVLDIRGAQ